jgi:LPS-assembly lipoprotein
MRFTISKWRTDTARSGRVTVTADYNLTKSDSGETIASGKRSAVAMVDFPSQEFAKLRAIRDAENRGARELAELIRADVASALARR